MNKLYFFSLILLVFSCQNSNKNKEKLIPTKVDHEQNPNRLEDSIEDTYSDSMINELVNGSIPTKQTSNDSNIPFLQLDCRIIDAIANYKINMDTIAHYQRAMSNVNTNLRNQLNLEYCIGHLDNTRSYDMYLFLCNSESSHTSNIVKLLTIPKTGLDVKSIDLAYWYGSENYDKVVQTSIINKNKFERTTVHTFRYIHNIGKIDSTSTTKEIYNISNNGSFNLSINSN